MASDQDFRWKIQHFRLSPSRQHILETMLLSSFPCRLTNMHHADLQVLFWVSGCPLGRAWANSGLVSALKLPMN